MSSSRFTFRATSRIAAIAFLAVVLGTLGGCEILGFLGQAVNKQVKAIYKIDDRPTLVLVDDPTDQLGDPSLEAMIASQVGHELTTAGAVKTVIPPDRVRAMAAKLGSEYPTTPIDKIGRDLGAAQVIAVYVESAAANADEEAFRPTLKARVRLIDTASGKRLFPPPDPGAAGDDMTATRGYAVNVDLFYRTTANGPGDAPVVLRKLVEKTGRKIAWIFFNHDEHEPGEKFAD